jgi:hypothetical protein
MKKIIIFLFLILVSNLFSQPQIQWTNIYPIQSKSLALDSLGNVIVVGYKDSTIFIIKYNPSGQIIWEKDTSIYHTPFGIYSAVDKFGNIYITCQANYARLYLIKYDSSGHQKWNNNDFSEYNECHGIALDTSGNVLITCESMPGTHIEYFTIKFNPQGQVLWYKRYGGNYGSRSPHSIVVDIAGSVYVTGESMIDTIRHDDYATIKYNKDGEQQWIAFYNGAKSGWDEAYSLCTDNNGYCYVTGKSDYFNQRVSCGSIKYNSNGDSIWTRLYPTDTVINSYGYEGKFIYTDNKNIFIAGDKSLYASIYGWAITATKYDNNGVLKWHKIDSGATYIRSAFLDKSSNLYLIGDGRYYMKGVGYDSLGNKIWDFDHPYHLYGAVKILSDKNGYIYLLSSTLDTSMLFKFSNSVGIRNENISKTKEYKLEQNYPNPFNPTTNIKYQIRDNKFVTLKVYDVLGREIETLISEKKKAGVYEVNFNGEYLSSGIYFYSIFIDGIILETKKMLLIK